MKKTTWKLKPCFCPGSPVSLIILECFFPEFLPDFSCAQPVRSGSGWAKLWGWQTGWWSGICVTVFKQACRFTVVWLVLICNTFLVLLVSNLLFYGHRRKATCEHNFSYVKNSTCMYLEHCFQKWLKNATQAVWWCASYIYFRTCKQLFCLALC